MSHRATSTKPFLAGTGVFEDQEATHWLPALKFMPPTSLLDDSMYVVYSVQKSQVAKLHVKA